MASPAAFTPAIMLEVMELPIAAFLMSRVRQFSLIPSVAQPRDFSPVSSERSSSCAIHRDIRNILRDIGNVCRDIRNAFGITGTKYRDIRNIYSGQREQSIGTSGTRRGDKSLNRNQYPRQQAPLTL